MTETWKAVEGWPYEVSDLGRVRRSDTGRVIATPPQSRGYPLASLYDRGRKWCVCVHQLVASAFLGPCPDGHEVNHVDAVKTNNRTGNLEYVTHQGNMDHATGAGRMRVRVSDEAVREIRGAVTAGETLRSIAARYGISNGQVSRIANGLSRAHVPAEVQP